MNPKTQFDFHPDVEALSAFAEQALTKKERGEITAHIAVCERCRQVVFLAQEAATQEEELAAVSAEKVGATRKTWLRNWRFLWAPAAAMAMAVVFGLYVHEKRTETATEMAKATQQVPPLAMARSGVDASTTKEVSSGSGVTMGEAGVAPKRPPVPPMAPFDSTALGLKGKTVNGGTEHVAPPPSPLVASQTAPGAADGFKPQTVETGGAGEPQRAEGMTQEQASMDAAEKSHEEKQEQSDRARAKDTSPASVPASPPTVGFSAGIRTARTAALYASKTSTLPTGLPANSTVKGSRVTLAVDKNGEVFVSTDNGSHWERVAPQWSGRAVTVRTQTKTPDTFELVNDQGQRWASPDGLVWTAE